MKQADAASISTRQVRFHDLGAQGEAVGRDEAGKTTFAPFGAPGDLARVQIEREKSSFARGEIIELLEFGPQRIAPPCPHFTPQTPRRSCGGCAWQHLNIRAQREAKRARVQNALERVGGLPIEVEMDEGASDFGYRNKADFVLGTGVSGEAQLGFFAASSHELVDISTCPIQRPENEIVLHAAREILFEHPDWAFDPRTGRGVLRRLVARVSSEGRGLVALVTGESNWKNALPFAQELKKRAPHVGGVIERGPQHQTRAVWGDDFLIERVNELQFRVSGDGFWQINAQMSPRLAQTALEWAQISAPTPNVSTPNVPTRALDLFCGAGLFALHLARAGAVVTGVERSKRAIEDARFNARANDLSVRFWAADSAAWLAKQVRNEFDVVLLDPPRDGAPEAVAQIARLKAPRVVYVSCDPATLARDARDLARAGYTLERARAFDLFPQTPHVETIALLTRD